MFISVFDIFKIGVGPSSSHTMGPMTAAAAFLKAVQDGGAAFDPAKLTALEAQLYGSLAFTGKGHATDRAVILGLMGFEPASLDADVAEARLTEMRATGRLAPPGLPEVAFDPERHVIFDYGPPLAMHANGMKLRALSNGAVLLEETYYSIGGGFIATESELLASRSRKSAPPGAQQQSLGYPYPFGSAAEMLRMGSESGRTVAEMKLANEETARSPEAVRQGLAALHATMQNCIDRGLRTEGELPGGLKVKRRAKAIHDRLVAARGTSAAQPHAVNDWLAAYALAVNEENAAGGRVVTSPTNGAAGVVPAVIRYYRSHCVGATDPGVEVFLLTAAAIGGIVKENASISGAELGCQAEVGSASAMAAAGLCAALGGTNAQVENAAEIALEHHLGMTCDPVRGLVQVPCIERNGLGAIKAVSAASLALHGDGTHFMPLDNCIETMRQTGLDMREKYKETSLGGLAVNFPEC
ncbi:L-serine ammonia-lyase [Paracoccus stylophorae]|uniref:L-serine dehydratase n=1 Tax=Paracoccus stylophorae TaxID=659350 RepID=A0ABY7SYB3_9RHOB|nr:L-serine ammonia-lyase [Paracoccus stylophorae]WCR12016.1 L-serine ammonia-lyase [Paracoccus stylophorae]